MRHPYNIINPSPWPFFLSLNLLSFIIDNIGIISGYNNINIKLKIIIIIIIMYLWWNDIIIELNYIGNNTIKMSKIIIIGFLVFLITEIMLFISFFWAYIHSSLNVMNLIWPPIGIDIINPWHIPLLNTFLLLYSGIIATSSHHYFINNNKKKTKKGLIITIILGIIFIFLQFIEYYYSTFSISDSIYGSSFFLLTGTHGLHVFIGLLFFLFTLLNLSLYHSPYILFDLSLLYWHFVDIIWILLFILIYYFPFHSFV